LSYEIRKGGISQSELPDLQGNRIARAIGTSRGKPPTNVDEIVARYPEVNFDQALINSTILGDLLFRGWVDKAALVKGLDSSSYFATPSSEPAWRTALQVWSLEDAKIARASEVLEGQFATRQFDVPGEMFQVFGTRLFLSEVGVIPRTKNVIRDESIKYIDDIKATRRIRNKYTEETRLDKFGG